MFRPIHSITGTLTALPTNFQRARDFIRAHRDATS